MKKFLTMLLSVVMAVACCFCVACGGNSGSTVKPYKGMKKVNSTSEIKAGLICLHDETSTYDKNFIDAFKAACEANGVTYLIKTNVPEGTECYEAAADLVDQGCNYVFADSFGHESYMLQAANEFPEVQFSHATGTNAHVENRGNFHNAFASIYEGRYLAGYAAGLKLNTMKDKAVNNNYKVGYVGAFTYAEVVSGYTAWFLGVNAALEAGYTATMDVKFTGSWYDQTGEATAAQELINGGCVLISQHADSMGAPNTCENAGVPNVSYNGSTETACPNTFIVASKINWAPYFTYCFEQMVAGEEIALDWTGTMATESVQLTALGAAAAAGTQAALDAVKAELVEGTRKVFDLTKMTVNGQALTATTAAPGSATWANFNKANEIVANGYYHESEFRSAPSFDVTIDGINLLNTKF